MENRWTVPRHALSLVAQHHARRYAKDNDCWFDQPGFLKNEGRKGEQMVIKPRSAVQILIYIVLLLSFALGPSWGGEPYREEVLGQSVEGREIRAFYFNDGLAPAFLVFASIHGDEPSAAALSKILEQRWTTDPSLLGGVRVIFIPCANPDGLARKDRRNANEVDCNRNFPEGWKPSPKGTLTYSGSRPLSEPESQILYDLVEKENPRAIVSIHSCRHCAGVNNYDGPAEAYAQEMSRINHYKPSPEWYAQTPGSFGTYAGKAKGIPTLTLEMPEGKTSEKDNLKNAEAIEAALRLHPAPAEPKTK
jgi:protein MpaA